jgi:hypothetical protein
MKPVDDDDEFNQAEYCENPANPVKDEAYESFRSYTSKEIREEVF